MDSATDVDSVRLCRWARTRRARWGLAVGTVVAASLMTLTLASIPGATAPTSSPLPHFTGCLAQDGTLFNVARGDAPVQPCKGNSTTVQLSSGIAAGSGLVVQGGNTISVDPAIHGGFGGMAEFIASGSWSAPSGVTHVVVEAWGAGGGGGSGGNCSGLFPTSGGGGGAGAYVRAVVPVTPGVTYQVTVGLAGFGTGANPPAPGGNGGDSSLTDTAGTQLVLAGGGQGGGATASGASSGGSGTFVSSGSGLVRTGQPGSAALGCSPPGFSPAAPGGTAVNDGTAVPWPGGNGNGGSGGAATCCIGAGFPTMTGTSGQPGYVLLTW